MMLAGIVYQIDEQRGRTPMDERWSSYVAMLRACLPYLDSYRCYVADADDPPVFDLPLVKEACNGIAIVDSVLGEATGHYRNLDDEAADLFGLVNFRMQQITEYKVEPAKNAIIAAAMDRLIANVRAVLWYEEMWELAYGNGSEANTGGTARSSRSHAAHIYETYTRANGPQATVAPPAHGGVLSDAVRKPGRPRRRISLE